MTTATQMFLSSKSLINNPNNSVAGIMSDVELTSCSAMSRSFLLKAETNSNITKSASWNKYNQDLEKFVCRVEDCPKMSWRSLVCSRCGRIVKQNIAKLTCLSPYCRDDECIKNRVRIAQAYFEALKIKSPNLLHIIFGFAYINRFTDEEKEKQARVFSLLEKEMERLGTPLHMVAVRDIKEIDLKPLTPLYVHYHTANLPVKDWRKFRQNLYRAREKIIKKSGVEFSFKFKHYRNQRGLFKYFAHRVAGVFGI
ncbi:unnamed protein product, partial [marine sediment metagenome]